MGRSILHLDMDAFFAAVEVHDDPSLAGKPLIIGSLPTERGVVSTCSYEARKFGVHSGMSIKDAYALCPEGIYMHGRHERYWEISRVIQNIMREYSDQVFFVACDEGYLDITASTSLFGNAETIGRTIKARVQEATGLTCSVGIGYNMMSAKLASEEKKPNGFFMIPDEKALTGMIIDRPIGIINGIGKKTAEALARYNIKTVRDVLALSEDELIRFAGDSGHALYQMAHGIDEREIPREEPEAKSFGHEYTFQEDLNSYAEIESALRLIAKEVSLGLHEAGLYVSGVTLKLKYANMQLNTRAAILTEATQDRTVLFNTARTLLHRDGYLMPVRLVGIQTTRFTDGPTGQITLEHNTSDDKHFQLDQKLASLYQKFGSDIISTGAELESQKKLFNKDKN